MSEAGLLGTMDTWNSHIQAVLPRPVVCGNTASGPHPPKVAREAGNPGLCCETYYVLKCW